FLGISPFPEIAAARAMPLLTSAVPNPELHNGLVLQMIDEVRHSTIQMHLKRYYMKNYIDPAGFDTTEKYIDRFYARTIGRQYAFWNNHALVDAAIGTFVEYGTKDRRKERDSYAQMWRRWIYDDYYRSYLMPLEKYGLKIHHEDIEEAWNRIANKGYVHKTAQ